MARLRPLVVVLLLSLPVLLAACTLPEEIDPRGKALVPAEAPIPGLSPPHFRSHPVSFVLTDNDTRAFVALAGTISRPDSRIAVLDLERGRLLRHIEVGLRPLDIVIDPQRPERAFVTHPYQPSLSVLDLDAGRTLGALPVPYYIEHIAFTADGNLVAADRDQDRVLVYEVERNNDPRGPGYVLRKTTEVRTGPNPEWIVVLGAAGHGLVAVSDRHGASVTLIDITSERSRRVPVGGAPLHLAAHDGFLLVGGYGPGNGQAGDIDGTNETGTADIENSLLVMDLRGDVADVLRAAHEIPAVRYVSDTARSDRAADDARLLAGADLRHIEVASSSETSEGYCHFETAIVLTFHGSDQAQIICLEDGTLRLAASTQSTSTRGGRLSPLATDTPLTPGNLSDSPHHVYETPAGPRASRLSGTTLYTLAEFPERLQALDLTDCPGPGSAAPCRSVTIPVVRDPLPYPTGIYEEGERLFHSALPSADQDRSCAACHIDGLANGGTWALPHRDLTPVRIPRLDDTADNAPWLLDGSVAAPRGYLDAAGGDLLAPDPDDPNNRIANGTDPANATIPPIVPGRTNATAWMEAAFAYALGELRLLPAPPRLTDDAATDARDGGKIFVAPAAECMSCHADTGRATLLDANTSRDLPRPPNADRLKAPSLEGLFDRQGSPFLWTGDVRTLPGALLPTGHACLDDDPGLQRPWHGSVADRHCSALADLATHLLTLDGRR